MFKHRVINLIIAVSFLGVSALPVYSFFFLTPAYDELIMAHTEAGLIELASQMVKEQNFDIEISENVPLPPSLIAEVERIRQTVGISKVKIFTPLGQIVYSSDQADIGQSTSKDFFKRMISDGRPRSVIEITEPPGLQQATKKIYQVETYVPIQSTGKTVGAFEIYFDITNIHKDLAQIKAREEHLIFPLVLGLFAAVMLSCYYANRSMSELKIAKEKFQTLAVTDSLTGLLNHRGFTSQVNRQLKIMARSGHRDPAYLIYIDLDNLKWVNDTLGHEIGNEAIASLAQILRQTFRQSDVLGRLGGDEFAVLALSSDTPVQEPAIRERLADQIEKYNANADKKYTIAVSMGFACFSPDSPGSARELIMKADNLMYEEKQAKKISPG